MLFCLLLLGCKGESDYDNTLLVGMSMDFPPFEYIENGKPVGFEVDLINEIGAIIGKKVKLVDIDFPAIIGSLNAGKIDIGVSGFSVTDERKKAVDFAECYYYPKIAVLIQNNTNIKTEDDLNNKKIGVQTGTTMELYLNNLKKKYPGLTIHSLSRNTHLVQELKLGRIDGVALENGQAVAFSKKNSNILTYAIVSEDKNTCYSMVFRKKSPLTKKFSDAIIDLQKNGKLKELQDKWLYTE